MDPDEGNNKSPSLSVLTPNGNGNDVYTTKQA